MSADGLIGFVRPCRVLNDLYPAIAIAMCTYPMGWFGRASRWFQHVSERSPTEVLKFIALLLSVPCFKASHFFFKGAYLLQQRRIRLLGGDDLPLQINRGLVPDIEVLQGLRRTKHAIECAYARKYVDRDRERTTP